MITPDDVANDPDNPEIIAGYFRQCLAEWSDRFTVTELKHSNDDGIAFLGHAFIVQYRYDTRRLSMTVFLHRSYNTAMMSNDIELRTKYIIGEFTETLADRYATTFEGDPKLVRDTLKTLLWKPRPIRSNSRPIRWPIRGQ